MGLASDSKTMRGIKQLGFREACMAVIKWEEPCPAHVAMYVFSWHRTENSDSKLSILLLMLFYFFSFMYSEKKNAAAAFGYKKKKKRTSTDVLIVKCCT